MIIFLSGNDGVTLLLIKNGADSYLRRKPLSPMFFGCIARNGKVALDEIYAFENYCFPMMNRFEYQMYEQYDFLSK